MESKIIGTARNINNYKAFWCIEKIQNLKLDFEIKNGRKPSVAFMGLSFKPNIDDLRESPALFIVKNLTKSSKNEKNYIVEPNIKSHSDFSLSSYNDAIGKADILVFLVAHDEFKIKKFPLKK